MNRRTFLSAAPTAIVTLASLKAPLFVPVDWMYSVPMGEGWYGGDVVFRRCDMCYDDFVADCCDNKPIRQYFETTDEYDYCVCEHCIGDYLSNQ